MDKKTITIIPIVVVLLVVCYFLPGPEPPPERPTYDETTMTALYLDENGIVSEVQTNDRDTLSGADAVILNYTDSQFDDYEDVEAFICELVLSGKPVLSEIGASVFSELMNYHISMVISLTAETSGVYYSPDSAITYVFSSDYPSVNEFVEWLNEYNYNPGSVTNEDVIQIINEV